MLLWLREGRGGRCREARGGGPDSGPIRIFKFWITFQGQVPSPAEIEMEPKHVKHEPNDEQRENQKLNFQKEVPTDRPPAREILTNSAIYRVTIRRIHRMTLKKFLKIFISLYVK